MSHNPIPGWYIACSSKELKKNAIARTINHLPFVIIRTQNHQVSAFLDKCPHRNIPLSSGSIQRDYLVCPYHGWEFNHNGICQKQPGNIDYQNQPRHNLIKYPAIELNNHVWIYSHPQEIPGTQPYKFPLIDQPGFTTFSWKITSSASLENIAENFLDATHTHFVHTRLIRTQSQRQEITVKITRNRQSVEAIYLNEQKISGLIYQLLAPGCKQITSIGRFILPSIAQLEYQCDRADYRLVISLVLTPVTDCLTQGYVFVTFRWGLPNWLGKLIAKPLFKIAARQDRRVLDLQSMNIRRFGEEDFVMTEIDLIKPHILYLLKNSTNYSQNYDKSENKEYDNWQKTMKIML